MLCMVIPLAQMIIVGYKSNNGFCGINEGYLESVRPMQYESIKNTTVIYCNLIL